MHPMFYRCDCWNAWELYILCNIMIPIIPFMHDIWDDISFLGHVGVWLNVGFGANHHFPMVFQSYFDITRGCPLPPGISRRRSSWLWLLPWARWSETHKARWSSAGSDDHWRYRFLTEGVTFFRPMVQGVSPHNMAIWPEKYGTLH